jgi:putative oxidoreductase
MLNSSPFLSSWAAHLLSVLRIVAMFNFISHGTQKTLGYPPTIPPFAWPPLLQFAGWIEIVFGTLVLVGLFTRPAAFILCGEMAVAYFRTHNPRDFWPLINGGEITVLYCFFFLFLVAAGPGAWSLDALRQRKLRPMVSSNA